MLCCVVWHCNRASWGSTRRCFASTVTCLSCDCRLVLCCSPVDLLALCGMSAGKTACVGQPASHDPSDILELTCHLLSFIGLVVHHAGRPTVHWHLRILHAFPSAGIYHKRENLFRRQGGPRWTVPGHFCGELIWFGSTSIGSAAAVASVGIFKRPVTIRAAPIRGGRYAMHTATLTHGLRLMHCCGAQFSMYLRSAA